MMQYINRKTATVFRMINWSRFQDVSVRLEGSTLFTGVNGSGKSTILDAMTYLLVGNTQFNKAAKDRDRDVKSYVRGDTRSNGKDRYLRTGAVISYLVMEFHSEMDDSDFLVGVCIESPNETEHRSHWFVLPDTRMQEVELTARQGSVLRVFPRNELKVRGKPLKMNVFMGREKAVQQILRALGLRCDPVKYRNKLLKMMAFNPENNIDKFIQDCVLDPGKVDSLKELREQKQKFEQLKEVYQNLSRSKRKLDQLERATVSYEGKVRQQQIGNLMWKYQEYQNTLQEKEEIERRSQALLVRKKELEEKLYKANEKLSAADQRCRLAESNGQLGDMRKSLEELGRQMHDLDLAIRDLERDTAKLLTLKQHAKALIKILPAEEIQRFGADSREDFIHRLDSFDAPAGDTGSRRDFAFRMKDGVLAYRENENTRNVRISDEIQVLKSEIGKKEKQIKSLENNRMVYPEEIESARRILRSEFESRGIHTEVRYFAQLVSEVKDESWRAAVETFLGRRRFHIIVDGRYCQEAMQILREKKLYAATVVVTDKLPETEVKEGSAAGILTIPNPFARRYANYLLNGIHLCGTLEELHEHPLGGMMKDGMLAKSYAVSLMKIKETVAFLGEEAIRIQLDRLKKEQADRKKNLADLQDMRAGIRKRIEMVDAVSWDMEQYHFDAPGELQQARRESRDLAAQKKRMEESPFFQAMLEELNEAEKQKLLASQERDDLVKSIGICDKDISDEEEKRKQIAGEIHTARREYEEDRQSKLELEQVMLTEYKRRKDRAKDGVAIRYKTITNYVGEVETELRKMEDLQIEYNRLAEYDLNRRGPSFIPFFREEQSRISNVKIEEASAALEEQSKTLEDAFMHDFVAEINEKIQSARAEMDAINRELKRLPFGNDTYRFVMDERPDRRVFFRICEKIEDYGSTDMLMSLHGSDEELEMDIRQFMDIILEEEDEEEYTDYRKYFTYDMKISSRQGDSRIEADLSRKQGSASNGEKQTPYFIILAASLMQCYPKDSSCVRLAFIDEAFSALSRERIERMVRYFEENHFQVIYAAPPEKIGSIGAYIQSTASLVITGRYTNIVEGLVKSDEIAAQ